MHPPNMSVNEHPQQPETTIGIDEKHPDKERHANVGNGEPESESSSYQMAIAGDNHLFAMTDPVLDSKMRLVNAVQLLTPNTDVGNSD